MIMKKLILLITICIIPICAIAQKEHFKLLGQWSIEDEEFGLTPYCFEITMDKYGDMYAKVPASYSISRKVVTGWQNTSVYAHNDKSGYYFEPVNTRQEASYGVNFKTPSGSYEYRSICVLINYDVEEETLTAWIAYRYGAMLDKVHEVGDVTFIKVGDVEKPQLIDNKQTRKKGDAGKVGEAIDLGLSVKWASWNVGASKPEDYGGYYAWGEIEEKDRYDWSTYKYCEGSKESCHFIGTNEIDISGTEYDIAHVKWGDGWRMPTKDEVNELRSNCTTKWIEMNGVEGLQYIGPNGNSIFLPAAGIYISEKVENDMTHWMWRESNFWSGTNDSDYPWASYILISDNHNGSFCNVSDRCRGNSVRPVKSK